MKALTSFVVGVVVSLSAVQIWQETPIAEGVPAPPVATENGDVNGDGGIDISDPLYILNWLFAAGDSPVPISDSPRLVSTGLEKCWGKFGSLDCSLPPAVGQDGYYQNGCPLKDRFVDAGDGTIYDRCTKFTWMKRYVDVNGDFEHSMDDALPWRDAIAFTEEMTFQGHDDWRVPNAHEFLSIISFSGNRTLHSPFSRPLTGGAAWTSTSGLSQAFAITERGCDSAGVNTSMLQRVSKDGPGFILAVRGPSPE